MIWKVALVAAVLLITGFVYATNSPTAAVRYRITVSFSFDGRPVSGSTVLEYDAHANSKFMSPDSVDLSGRVVGDAIPIALSDSQTLFVLHRALNFPFASGYGAFVVDCIGRDQTGPVIIQKLNEFRGQCDSQRHPAIALYSRLSGGYQLELIDYKQSQRVTNLNIHVAWTDEAVTRGIATTYPWIKALPMSEPVAGDADQSLPAGQGIFETGNIYRVDFSLE